MITPANPRVLVCGGRDFTDTAAAAAVLGMVQARYGIAVVIEGEARGADTLARDWAQMCRIPVEPYFAEWHLFGHRAGPIRNERMLREGKPDLAIAFPGGSGTADMVRRLKQAGVPTLIGRYHEGQLRWTINPHNSLAPTVHVK